MFEPGDVIDRNYGVIERLAMGGAGVTYLVRALDDAGEPSGPKIALKMLFTARDHGAYLRRLSTEAQILQELQHPNIVQYLGFVHRTGQSPYLLTQFEEGGSLLDHMRRVGKLGIRECASVGRQVCWALEKGHAQGIIHRDLKPENLLLEAITEKGSTPTVRVADFGIAKVSGSLSSGLTRAGAFVGTPQYAAPEQFVGDPASDKADIYALGAVMMFLLTARPLVADAHTLASEDVYTRLLDALPPQIQLDGESPDDVERFNQVLARAMAISPDERCSVGELDRMLAALLDNRDPTAPVMSLSTDNPTSSIPLTVFSDDGGGRTAGGLDMPVLAASPTPTARDIVEPDDDRQDEPLSAPSEPDATPPPPVGDSTGTLPLLFFLAGTVLAALVGLGIMFWPASETAHQEDPLADVLAEPISEAPEKEVPVVAALEEEVSEEPVPTPPPEVKEEPPRQAPVRPAPAPERVLDAVANPEKGATARRAADRAFRRNAQVIRRNCPDAVGQTIEVEAVVGRDGRIQSARPVNRTRPAFKCVADNMLRVKSGSRLTIATKVRLDVRP